MRRRGILVTVWLAGTVLATFLAWSAVSLVGATVTETQAARTDLVVAERPASTAGDGVTRTSTTVPPAVTGVASGGQATWMCDGDTPTLVDASPHIGWERDTRAPDGEVWFDHDGDDSAIVADCDDGLPVVEIHEEDYDEDEGQDEGDDEGDDQDEVTTTVPPTTAASVAPPATVDDGGDVADDSDSSGSGSDHDDDPADDVSGGDRPDEPDDDDPADDVSGGDRPDEPDEDKPEDD